MSSQFVSRLVQFARQQLNRDEFDPNSFVAFLSKIHANEAVAVLAELPGQRTAWGVSSLDGELVNKWLADPTVGFDPFSWTDHLRNAPYAVLKSQIKELNSVSPEERYELEALIYMRNDQPESDHTWIPTEIAYELLELLSAK